MPGAGALLAAIQVLVTVLDADTGAPVPGLTVADFDAPVRVESVAVADSPMAILLAVDSSAAGGVVRRIATDLTRQLRPQDRMAVMAIGSQSSLRQPFTADQMALGKAVEDIAFAGDPRLMDGLASALHMAFPDQGYRRVVLLVTAGVEGLSHTQEADIVSAAREKGIAVYPVYLHGSGRWIFPSLAARTGGAAFWTREMRPAEAIFAAVRSPYLLTLSGPATAIKVKGREKTFVSILPFQLH